MKKLIISLLMAVLLCNVCAQENATLRTVTKTDSDGRVVEKYEVRDSTVDGKQVTDTLSVTRYDDSQPVSAASESEDDNRAGSTNLFHEMGADDISETIVAVTAIFFIFGLPVFVILIIFYFRYKNRKAKYRLMEQALNSGQPLPDKFFDSLTDKSAEKDTRTAGIRNAFLGLGLFVFFWALTDEFSIACIGLLVMFTGFGQLVIYYTNPNRKPKA